MSNDEKKRVQPTIEERFATCSEAETALTSDVVLEPVTATIRNLVEVRGMMVAEVGDEAVAAITALHSHDLEAMQKVLKAQACEQIYIALRCAVEAVIEFGVEPVDAVAAALEAACRIGLQLSPALRDRSRFLRVAEVTHKHSVSQIIRYATLDGVLEALKAMPRTIDEALEKAKR